MKKSEERMAIEWICYSFHIYIFCNAFSGEMDGEKEREEV